MQFRWVSKNKSERCLQALWFDFSQFELSLGCVLREVLHFGLTPVSPWWSTNICRGRNRWLSSETSQENPKSFGIKNVLLSEMLLPASLWVFRTILMHCLGLGSLLVWFFECLVSQSRSQNPEFQSWALTSGSPNVALWTRSSWCVRLEANPGFVP